MSTPPTPVRPTISVAMCTYNGSRYLAEQLKSFLNQQSQPSEVVVCDDGSSDATVDLLHEFASIATFPVRIHRNHENLGYSRNFTQAVNLCSGDVIALSDQDDVWYPQKLSQLQQFFAQHPQLQGVFSDGDIINDDSVPVGRTLWRSFLFSPSDQARFASGRSLDVLLKRNVVTGMTLAFRRGNSTLLKDRPNSWMHDGWLAIALALSDGLQACPERLVGYRAHGDQQVGTPATLAAKLRSLLSKGTAAYIQRVHAKNLDEYQRTSLQFVELYRYVSRHADINPAVLCKVARKAQHAHRGAHALLCNRFRRLALLLPHVRSYIHFSPNGLRGLIRDLIV